MNRTTAIVRAEGKNAASAFRNYVMRNPSVTKISAIRFLAVVTLFLAINARGAADDPVEVSMVHLLANPTEFHGKLIQVEGYLHVKFEDECLYLSKEDADFLNGKHGVWISYGDQLRKRPDKQLVYFDCKRVSVIGIFDKDMTGHFEAAGGGLKNVTFLGEETRWYDGKKSLKH